VNELPQIPPDYALGEWLRGEGPDADIAVCTRVRFARNLRDHRFSTSMTATEATELVGLLSACLESLPFEPPLHFIPLESLEPLEREVLVERHLISRELARSQVPGGVATDTEESTSVMVNEEDHLRSQVFRSGFRAEETYEAAEALDDALISRLEIAFSEEFGFLTACPTNSGTGLRVSVMLHLPGLVWAEEIEKAASTCQKIHLAVRGLYGEGSRALGDYYQVSNQVTLGRTEQDILADVRTAVERLIEWERDVRSALLEGNARGRTLDRVHRSLGVLENAWLLNSEECLTSLSAIRFGVQQGLVADLSLRDLHQILLLTQPAHLQRTFKERLGPDQRDDRRARLVRGILARARNGGA
jgi:protein arginine kinase